MKLTFIQKSLKGVFAVLFLVAFLGIQNNAIAQIPASSYGFTAVAGTYTNLVGGTTFTAVQSDDVCPTATIPIGFTFNFCSVDYNTIRAGSNGYLTFSTASASTADNSTSGLNTIKPGLFWLFDDINGAAGAASYTTTGSAPNRVFTFQYKNWAWNWSATGPNISCQIKLYETTNIIEYVYNPESAPGNPSGSSGASIGICDGATTPTYLSLNNATATPTASSTTFTSNITTKPAAGQIYRFTPPPACNVVANLPTSGTTAATPASICLSGNVTLSVTPNVAMPAATGITYKWQVATAAAGPYTDIPGAVTTLPSYTTTTPITASSYFRGVALCNATTTIYTASASNQVVVNNPGNPTGIPGSRCGPGSVALSATPPAGNTGATLNWYTAATGGVPVQTGATYNTPYLTATTNFYVAASSGAPGSPQTLSTITTGGNGCSGGVMFDINPNVTIFVDSFKAMALSTATNQTVNVYKKNGTYLGSETNAAAWTLVATVTNVNMVANQMCSIPLPASINITQGTLTGIYLNYNSAYTTISAPATYSNADLSIISGAGLCAQFATVNPLRGFNGSVHYRTGSCEGNRVPVAATINSSPVVTKTAPAVVCNNSVATVTLTPPTPAYSSYTWTPVANLYTNAAATTPYVAGSSATTVYLKTTNVGTQSLYLMAGNPALTTGCTYADTVSVWVQPGNVAIKGNPDTICVTGATTLKLDTIAGYYPGSIQWQTSPNGTTYTNVTGATASSYTTPSLSFGQNTYYRAQISAANTVCQSPAKYVVVANPTLLSAPDSFNCGPGTVTLSAVTGGNGSAVWYANASGGLPIGSGSPFITPYLGSTTSFYVASRGGGVSGSVITSAGGTTSGTQTVNPYAAGWGGTKIQYLIKATELTALGIPANANLTSLAFDVVTPSGSTYPGFAVSMKNTTTTALTTSYESGATEVFAPTDVVPVTGLNTYTFTTPFVWDGTSNLLVQACWSNATTNANGTTVKCDNTTFVSTHRGQKDSQTPAAMCGITLTGASTNSVYSQRPKFVLGFDNKCESPREEVVAHIYPVPVVNLGPDVNNCLDNGTSYILNAGVQPNIPQYLWNDNSTSQILAVSESGEYFVQVTNEYSCAGSDTIKVVVRYNPQIDLGNDTTVCNGVTLTLDPGNTGSQYFWNTGQVTHTINVNNPGSYNVFVTNNSGCTSADTIVVSMQGELPSIQGIQVSNNGQYSFHFTAVNPQNVIGYDWDFGDSSAHSYLAAPNHTYANNGNYTVVLNLSSTCGFVIDTLGAHIVGIHQINVSNDELSVYPNPTANIATISITGDLKMERVEVYNVLGQIIYKKDADSNTKHKLDLGAFASGMYTIQVYTNKGTVARKLEILR